MRVPRFLIQPEGQFPAVMPLDPRERTLVKLAVDVAREAMEAAGTVRGDTPAVRLALRVLLPHCPERPLADVGDGDPGSRNRQFVKHDFSRFSVSNSPFRERAIGNRFWERGCPGQLPARTPGLLSRYGFLFGKKLKR